ncbi:endonuclease [Flammeovirga sp. SJP92]|uniref:endonuclease n=1 Tax=Flammeovirga sp. SJP92 TaxID=1775430 RepID=UPI0007873EE6|nr:endonuclease [Flammeovirga sp. SJP92]KXX70329.1 hypothetical protein AVL50_12035 [Flammeovirga sp. SJP92]
MKNQLKGLLLLKLMALIITTSYAQIPANYYRSAQGKSGSELKNALHSIIDGHREYPYSSSSTDVWDILKETDKDPNNPNNVILFYTGWSVNANQEYNSGKGWNREHVWAKSHGNFGTSQGAGTDCHHLRPTDITVNSARNSRWFDEASVEYIDGDGATGNYTSSSEWIWEPRPEVKGDVARMLFYMATRYEGTSGDPDLELVDYLPSNDYTPEPIHAKLSTLIAWHLQDPVDDFERNRNEVVYSYQGNRNPYIDHPEYVCLVYNCGTPADTAPPTKPSNLISTSITSTSFHLAWSPSSDNVGVTGYKVYVNGILSKTTSNPSVTIEGLTSGTSYQVAVSAVDQVGNESSQSTSINVTTSNEDVTPPNSDVYVETFSNFSAGGSYQSGSFVGDNEISWNYYSSRGDISIEGSTPTFGKGKNPAGALQSSVIAGGIGTLSFEYMQAFSTSVSFKVYVNSVLVTTVQGGSQNQIVSAGPFNVNMNGNCTLRFEQSGSSSGQVAIDNVTWTSLASADTQAPTQPTLDVSEITTTTATMNWTSSSDNVGVEGYKVIVNGNEIAQTASTSFVLQELEVLTTYTVEVIAFDAAGNNSARAISTFSTLDEIPVVTEEFVETFDNFSEGGSYKSGSFVGSHGITWTYASARGDLNFNGTALTLGKGRSPAGALESSTISGGVQTLSFDYSQAYSTAVKLEVYVNNVYYTTVEGGSKGSAENTGDIQVGVTGDARIKLVQKNTSSGQIKIDNLTWTTAAQTSSSRKQFALEVTALKLLSNPVTDVLRFQNAEEGMQYEIISMEGKTVNRGVLGNSVSIATEGLPKGVYILKMLIGDQIQNLRFVKN